MVRKITCAVARIKECVERRLYLDKLDSKRDWGKAKEYVDIDQKHYSPAEFGLLCGDTSKSEQILGCRPKIKLCI